MRAVALRGMLSFEHTRPLPVRAVVVLDAAEFSAASILLPLRSRKTGSVQSPYLCAMALQKPALTGKNSPSLVFKHPENSACQQGLLQLFS